MPVADAFRSGLGVGELFSSNFASARNFQAARRRVDLIDNLLEFELQKVERERQRDLARQAEREAAERDAANQVAYQEATARALEDPSFVGPLDRSHLLNFVEIDPQARLLVERLQSEKMARKKRAQSVFFESMGQGLGNLGGIPSPQHIRALSNRFTDEDVEGIEQQLALEAALNTGPFQPEPFVGPELPIPYISRRDRTRNELLGGIPSREELIEAIRASARPGG